MKAVIYARYSCDNQREESIDGQLRECKEFAERKGMILVDAYRYSDVSKNRQSP
jgi:site-specific DNA recombinase